MSRSRRGFAPYGRLAVAAAVVGLLPAVAACDAGADAPTSQFHPESLGINTIVHGIYIRDAFVIGSQTGGSLPAGATAGFYLGLYADGKADRLVSVTAPGTAASVVLPPGGIGLASQQAVYLTGPQPKILLDHLVHSLADGQTVRIRLNFLNAGSVTLSVPVLPRTGSYATFSPAPNPSPSTPNVANTLIPATTQAHTARRHHKKAARHA